MNEAFDLFGEKVEVKTTKPQAKQTVKETRKLDRRSIWSGGGYLAAIDGEDDDISLIGTECFTENATIERLEQALHMAPLIKNGVWSYSGTFWDYRITKPVYGDRKFGPFGSILRESTHILVKASAYQVLEQCYTCPESWLPKNAGWLFCKRLRMARPDEDPYELLKAFVAVISQQDFLDASRTGDTLRRVIKRERMRSQRAAEREARD
jgi:hypothetical protein